MEGKNPKGSILCLNVVVYIYIENANYQNINGFIKTYQKIIALRNRHSGGLLFSRKCPRVMKCTYNVVAFAS